MKVLMLTPTYDPIVGGAEFVVKSLTNKLNELGIHTDVMTFNMDKIWYPVWKNDFKMDNGYKIYRIKAFNLFQRLPVSPTHFLFNISVIPDISFRRIFKKYDILHFHNDLDLTFPLFSINTENPKLLHCHTLNSTMFHFYDKRLLWKRLFNLSSDYFLGCCEPTLDLISELGVSHDRIKKIPYSVDTDLYKPAYRDKIDNLVLFVGRLEPRKGLHVLLESLDYIKSPIKLLIIPIDVGLEYSEKVNAMIKKQNKKGFHEIIVKENVTGEEVIPFYQKAAVFVCPSLEDVFPTVNPQALASGTPLIASDVGSISEIFDEEDVGILVPPADPLKLGEAINRLLTDRSYREKCGRQGRKLVKRKYSLDSVVKRLIKIYEEIV